MIMLLEVRIQTMRPRKPRNFYEKMPEGLEDNYIDEMFLKGLVHKSKIVLMFKCLADSFPHLHYPSMIKETLEIVHVVNTLV